MNTVKVSDVVQRRDPVLKVQGCYQFEDLPSQGDVVCDWVIESEAAGLNIRGNLHGILQLECARCLQAYPLPIDLALDEQYVFERYVDPYGGREKELLSSDFYEVIDEEGELDLADLVHQFLILEASNQQTCGQPECGVQSALPVNE